jgi:hypothetical protein
MSIVHDTPSIVNVAQVAYTGLLLTGLGKRFNRGVVAQPDSREDSPAHVKG